MYCWNFEKYCIGLEDHINVIFIYWYTVYSWPTTFSIEGWQHNTQYSILNKGGPWIPYLSIFAPNSHFLGFGFAIQTIGRKFYRRATLL